MHYEEKIRPQTQELIQSVRDENEGKLPKGALLACIKKATKEILEQETDANKDAVTQKLADHVKLQEEKKLPPEKRTPESFLE